jgi:predicted DNA-binding transcriptional regulator YafY
MRPDIGRILSDHVTMDSPSSRSLRLLSLLQNGGEWTIAQLAAQLDASERTVRRDASRLRDLGYDVRSRPGPGAGYRLLPSMRIPPLLLEPDEISTIVTSLLVLEAWTPGDPAVSAARAKLEQLLPEGLRRRAAAMAMSTQILRQKSAEVDWAILGVLADAVAAGARVRFDYRDQRGRGSVRVVQPYRHVLRDRRWYLIGYDVDRADWRLFRLDRVKDVAPITGSYAPREFPSASIETWLESDFGRATALGDADGLGERKS